MRRSRSVARRAPWCSAIVGLLAAFVSFALLTCGVAVADTVETNFESLFTTGIRQRTGRLEKHRPEGYDQRVVASKGIAEILGLARSHCVCQTNAVTSGNFK